MGKINCTCVDLSTDINYPADVKLHLVITPKEKETKMDGYEFEFEFFCRQNKVKKLSAEEVHKVDDNNYKVCFSSTEVGAGQLQLQLTTRIPDPDFVKGYRTEVDYVETGYNIVRRL